MQTFVDKQSLALSTGPSHSSYAKAYYKHLECRMLFLFLKEYEISLSYFYCRWYDGTAVSDSLSSTWLSTQPRDGDQCAKYYFYQGDDPKRWVWFGESCGIPRNYICEKASKTGKCKLGSQLGWNNALISTSAMYMPSPPNTKHLYNICTTPAQRRRRWAGVVQMLYKCLVFAGYASRGMFYCFIWHFVCSSVTT